MLFVEIIDGMELVECIVVDSMKELKAYMYDNYDEYARYRVYTADEIVLEGRIPADSEYYCFTDTVPGKRCNNGGEYGFYTELYPTPVEGVFIVKTSTTCDFDSCGTGFEGFFFFDVFDIENMLEASDRIENEGSLY